MSASIDGGIGIGVETTRSYLAEDIPSGAHATVVRYLKTLVGRDDVIRIWFTPIGSKTTIWEHSGPLVELPDIAQVFEEHSGVPAAA